MADLRTDFKDDVLNVTTNEKRKYRMINNADGTISFEDVTDYVQQGDTFGATEVNQIIEKVNSCLTRQDVVDNLESTATDLPLSANMGNLIAISLIKKAEIHGGYLKGISDSNGILQIPAVEGVDNNIIIALISNNDVPVRLMYWGKFAYVQTCNWDGTMSPNREVDVIIYYVDDKYSDLQS